MKTILSLAYPFLVEPACRSGADIIRLGPYPGESLEVWETDGIIKGVNQALEFGKSVQVRLPVYPRSSKERQRFDSLLKELKAQPEVELVVGAWHQFLLESPNPKVAGGNLNITNSEEVHILKQWEVNIVTLPPRWSPGDDDFWKNVPETTCFECHIDGPVHVGWICLDGPADGDLIPPNKDSSLLCIRRGHIWSKDPVHQSRRDIRPSIDRGIIECWSLNNNGTSSFGCGTSTAFRK